jgi:type II secretory pathway component PulF
MIPSYRNECIIKKLPIFASLALHHEIIRIVWHFTLTVPSKTPIQKAIHFSTQNPEKSTQNFIKERELTQLHDRE